jgi:hypothetical protein
VDRVAGLIKEVTIVTKPIKAHSLYNATRSRSDPNGRTTQKSSKKASGMDPNYVKVSSFDGCRQKSCVDINIDRRCLARCTHCKSATSMTRKSMSQSARRYGNELCLPISYLGCLNGKLAIDSFKVWLQRRRHLLRRFTSGSRRANQEV